MPRGISPKTHDIRESILVSLSMYPGEVIPFTQKYHGVTRQTVHRHLKALVDAGDVIAEGRTKSRTYRLTVKLKKEISLKINSSSEEDKIWRKEVRPQIVDLKQNVIDICQHGVTEMVNNVIDHSGSDSVKIMIIRTAVTVQIVVSDNGIGIFKKIQQDFDLNDPRQALLELSKGKLTSDAANHSGEGIFFTSRMFDRFFIRSGRLRYACVVYGEGFLFEALENEQILGTDVSMTISFNTKRTDTEVFNEYTDSEDFSFSKTHVPVNLASYDHDQLVSRSAAKRLLSRFDKFKEVWLDFSAVEKVGQAFSDEIFRVFAKANPEIKLIHTNANEQVMGMIKRAKGKG